MKLQNYYATFSMKFLATINKSKSQDCERNLGAHHWEHATLILSLGHADFTHRSIFGLLVLQNGAVTVYMSVHCKEKWWPQFDIST